MALEAQEHAARDPRPSLDSNQGPADEKIGPISPMRGDIPMCLRFREVA
jgi:hypothetical protein